jgi:hypothetical protein
MDQLRQITAEDGPGSKISKSSNPAATSVFYKQQKPGNCPAFTYHLITNT